MRKMILLVPIILMLPILVAAEDTHLNNLNGISGMVVQLRSETPLIGAHVILLRDGENITGTATDDKGEFILENIAPGKYRLQISYIGYEDYVREIDVNEQRILELHVELRISTIAMSPLEILGESYSHYEDVAGTVTMFDKVAVRAIKPVGTQELLEMVPGVNGFADDGIGNSRISIGIRGLNPRRSSRVLVLEDGAPIQPAIYVYANMYYNPPAERIDRMEVIKGSGAIRYGPQTMGGVVNYLTSRPRQNFGGQLQFTGGNNGYNSLFGELGGWGTKRIKPELQLLVKRGDGFRDNNDFEQYNTTFKLNILPDSKKTIYLKANVNYEDANATYTGLTEYSFRNSPLFNPKENDNFKVFRSSVDLIYTNQISTRFGSESKVFFSYFDRRWWRENDIFVRAAQFESGIVEPTFPDQVGDLIRIGNGRDNFGILRKFYVAGVEHAYTLRHGLAGKESSLEIGGRIYWERFIDDKKIGDSPDARDGIYFIPPEDEDGNPTIVGQSQHYETTALAGFVNEKIQLGKLAVSPGIRFEIFEQERIDRLRGSIYQDKTTAVLLPGIGLNYDLGSMRVFAGIHRGFTPPSSGTLRIGNFGDQVVAGGLDLEAEKSWNSEIGIRGSLPALIFEVAAFNVAIEDLVAAGRGTAFKNLGQVTTRGIEVGGSFRANAVSGLLPEINISYAYLDTEIISGRIESAVLAGGVEVDIAGNELPYSPRHTLTVGLAKDLGFGLTFRADMRYVDDVFTDFENVDRTFNRGDTGPIPGYTIVNTSTSYRINSTWEFFAVAKNILDEIYIGSRLHSNPGQKDASLSSGILPGPRRQVNAGFRYTF